MFFRSNKKEEKDTPRTGSKLNNYFLRSGPLHDYFLPKC